MVTGGGQYVSKMHWSLVVTCALLPLIPGAPTTIDSPNKAKTMDIVHSSFGEALTGLFQNLEIQDDGPYQVKVKADPKTPIFPYHYQGYPFDYHGRKSDRLRGYHNGYPPISADPYGSRGLYFSYLLL